MFNPGKIDPRPWERERENPALTGGTVLSIWNAQLAARSPQRLPEPFLQLRIPGAFLNQMVLGFTVGTPHVRLDPAEPAV